MDNETKIGCIAAIIAMVPSILLRGWALKTLWLWFIVPTFAVNPISIPAAYGMAIVTSLLIPFRPDDGGQDVWKNIMTSLIYPPIAVAFGWVVAQWM